MPATDRDVQAILACEVTEQQFLVLAERLEDFVCVQVFGTKEAVHLSEDDACDLGFGQTPNHGHELRVVLDFRTGNSF